jgi:uncharacterized OB-fold protein
MAWTDEDEKRFLAKRREHFAKEEDEKVARRKDLTRAKCPECGSRNYIEATKSEICDDCGYEQSYW